MFEAAEVGRKLEKDIYKAQVPILRAELLDAQQQLLRAPFPVIVLFAGVDAAGKSETASLLNEWMDPHWIVTRGYMDPSDGGARASAAVALLARSPAARDASRSF